MVFAHGLLDAFIAISGFYLAIRFEQDFNSPKTLTDDHVVFFDDVCVLCSSTVAALIQLDKNRVLKYSSLHGEYARKFLDRKNVKAGESVIFRSGGRAYEKSEAAIQILKKLGGIYAALGLLLSLLLLFILNAFVPKPEDRTLFLP